MSDIWYPVDTKVRREKVQIYFIALTENGHADTDNVLFICDIPSMAMPLCQQNPHID